MDVNPEQQLTEKIRHCQKTVGDLLKEYESLLQKQKSTEPTSDSLNPSDTAANSEHSVKQSPVVDGAVTKQLKDIGLAFKSNQQQLRLALAKYLNTQSVLPTSADCSAIQSDDNHGITEDAKDTINQQVKLSDDNEAKLNPLVQALFTGTLPDDFFLHLLSVMGIQECLLSNRLVCSLWNELVLDRCHNQKSLKLFETFDRLVNYGELLLEYEKTDDPSLILKSIGDDLLFEGLGIDHKELVESLNQAHHLDSNSDDSNSDDSNSDDSNSDDDEDDTGESKIQTEMPTREKKLEASKVLTALFPQIEELVLCTEYDTLINIEHLLQFYAKQLTSLTMTHFGFMYENPASKLRDFTFPKLKSLNSFWFSPKDDQLRSLLPQLESLTLSSTEEMSLETLLRTGTQLCELNIDTIDSVYSAPEDAFSKRPKINSNLRKFTFGFRGIKLQALEFISLNLTSLECLKLNLRGNRDNVSHLTSLTPYLVPLHQLHSLTLKAPLLFFRLNRNQLDQIKPLPSVRQLKLLLCDYASFSINLFSRALFAVFPNVEKVLITFVDDFNHKNASTIAAFEAFASKNSKVVQLFRSGEMSKFTYFPDAVAPLFGHRRQVYEEYLAEEELFGVSIDKLRASFVKQHADYYADYHEHCLNVMSALRPGDRLTAMSNLLQLLQEDWEDAALDFKMIYAMIKHMLEGALKYDSSQVELFTVTLKCVDSLLHYQLGNGYDSEEVPDFLYKGNVSMSPFYMKTLKLLEHYQAQQFKDKKLLLQLYQLIGEFLSRFKYNFELNYEFNYKSLPDNQLDEYGLFKSLLKLVDHYQTLKLTVLDHEGLLLQIRDLMDSSLQMFCNDFLDQVISEFLHSENGVYRVEMARALLRNCKSTDKCFKLLSRQVDSDPGDSDSNDSDSSEGDSNDSITSDVSFSSAESEPEL